MNILALDLGTRCGWARTTSAGVESGVQVFDVKRGESPGMRYLRFRHWLEEMTAHSGGAPLVGLVVYEQTHNRGGAATEVAAGFAARVQEQCAAVAIDHAAVHSATLKKFWTGSGRGDKTAMRTATERRGIAINVCADDNEIDAVALLHYAMTELVPTGARS